MTLVLVVQGISPSLKYSIVLLFGNKSLYHMLHNASKFEFMFTCDSEQLKSHSVEQNKPSFEFTKLCISFQLEILFGTKSYAFYKMKVKFHAVKAGL